MLDTSIFWEPKGVVGVYQGKKTQASFGNPKEVDVFISKLFSSASFWKPKGKRLTLFIKKIK